MQRTSTEYFKQSGCVGCHHQPLVGMAVERASKKSIPIDRSARAEQIRVVKTEWQSAKEVLLQGVFISVDSLSHSLLHLADAGYPADETTDALAAVIASQQQPDGTWLGLPISRPPLEDSVWIRTSMAARALARYTIPARRIEFDRRVANARRWLSESRPNLPYERTFQLLGLIWTGGTPAGIARAATGSEGNAEGRWRMGSTGPTRNRCLCDRSSDVCARGIRNVTARSGIPARRGLPTFHAVRPTDRGMCAAARRSCSPTFKAASRTITISGSLPQLLPSRPPRFPKQFRLRVNLPRCSRRAVLELVR